MAKMWAVAVAFAVAVAWTAMLGSCTQVHFNSTHKDCENETMSIIDQCDYLFGSASLETFFKFLTTDMPYSEFQELMCIMRKNAITCVETAQCHCAYSADHAQQARGYAYIAQLTHYYNNQTNCGDAEYGESIGSDVFGPIELTPGINCTEHNKTAGDIALALAIANAPAVIAIAEGCEPMRDCYRQYDSEASVSLYNQDLHTTCMAIGKLVECIVNATCECGLNKNDTLREWVSSEKYVYEDYCDIVIDFPALEISGIVCPGMRNCEYDDPVDHCFLLWYDAYMASTTIKGDCLAELDWARCIEGLACDCGFFNDSTYYHALAVSRHFYEDECSGVINETGPFPNHTGINCTDKEDELLVIALEQIGFISTEEARCPGVFLCYNDTIDEVNEAYRTKDLPAICQLEDKRLSCLEMRNCECGIFWEPDVLEKMKAQKNEFHFWCTDFGLESEFPLIVCPNCVTPDEQNTCEEHHKAVADTAWWYPTIDYCRALHDLVNCTETVACECGFYNESSYYHNLTIAKANYEGNDCPDYIGEFPSHKGLICLPVDIAGEPQQLVSVALADTEYVKAEDDACPGIKQCYLDAEDKYEEAYHIKDLTALCEAQEERILCVERRYCECGKTSEDETMEKIIAKRNEHYDLCYYMTGMMSVEPCRDQKICRVESPLVLCDMEYDMEFYAAENDAEMCRATKHYLLCMEEVGCMCGLLANGSSDIAIAIHNFTMYGMKFYKEVDCHLEEALITPEEDGIQCPGQPDDVLRKLVLSYADSSEAAAFVSKCYRVHKCFRDDEKTRAAAIYSRDYIEYCEVQRDFIHCLDEAYCRCGMNGTEDVEGYVSWQLYLHNDYCYGHVDEITRRECVSLTVKLERNCSDFKDCREGVDDRLADALVDAMANKSYTEFCDEKKKLIECADKAFCDCKLDGTDDAKEYRKAQMSYHSEYCTPAIGDAKKCKEPTEAAGNLRSSALLIILILLAGLYGPSWMLGTPY